MNTHKSETGTEAPTETKPEKELSLDEVYQEAIREHEERFSDLSAAFRYEDGGLDNVRAILSVGYLLFWCAEGLNSDVRGEIVGGLSHILDKCAKEAARGTILQNKLERYAHGWGKANPKK